LELTVGPFQAGTGRLLRADGSERPASPLVLLSDEVSVEHTSDEELLHVVVIDHR
jgi:hypothetical protein